jgi:hypothetical protein
VTDPDLLRALRPVLVVLEALGIAHYVGGSVASSVHGLPRASIDVDVVADLDLPHIAPFVRRLEAAFYVEETRVRSAVELRRSFNLIHLETMLKVDVFVSKRRPWDREALARARPEALTEGGANRSLIASPEDTILAKLEWFRLGGETSERQWADILGVLKTVGGGLDDAYMRRWATSLGVEDLLDRALAEAGRRP